MHTGATHDADEDDTTLPSFTREGRVLVAEDDSAMRELVVQVLEADGREVVEVSSGDELLNLVKRRSVASWPDDAFDVIVTDHRMQHGNGLDAVERLRLLGCTTPILLISAFIDKELHARADELGTVVMCKPFPLDDFRTAVDVLLAVDPWRRALR